MQNRYLIPSLVLFFCIAGVSAMAGTALAQTGSPQALVADLYKKHDAQKGPFFQKKSRALVDRYFTKMLGDLIWKDATSPSSDEVGALDGDPLYNAQDTEIKHFVIGKGVVKGTSATVPVTFTNFGKKESIKFMLMKVKGAWKIDDIRYSATDTLSSWLKAEN